MKRLIIFLIRLRLGLKKYEKFRFSNQASPDNYYYFTDDAVMKHAKHSNDYKSSVSLNWLIDDDCKIERVKEK